MKTPFSWSEIKVDFGDSWITINPQYTFVVVLGIVISGVMLRRALLRGYVSRERAERWVIDLTYIGSILCIIAIGGSSSMFQGRFPVAIVAIPRAITIGLFMLIIAWDLQTLLHAARGVSLPESTSLRFGLKKEARNLINRLKGSSRSMWIWIKGLLKRNKA